MWVETQDGIVVINLETGSYVYLDERKDGWKVILETAATSHILGRYKAEQNAREMLDAFKQKLRRCGERIFKFKEEAEKMKFPIKFRGRDVKTGEYVYGGLYQDNDVCWIIYIQLDYEGYPCPEFRCVDPESVAQLVGYDEDGKELYTGDPVVDEYGEGWASLVARVGIKVKPVGAAFDDHRLKESTENDAR